MQKKLIEIMFKHIFRLNWETLDKSDEWACELEIGKWWKTQSGYVPKKPKPSATHLSTVTDIFPDK